MTHKRLTLFAGHYGSGKTNIALNYARWLRRKGEAVTVADLDIVNPYFRTKDSEEDLKKEGIGLIVSPFANSNLDVPAMPKETYALIAERGECGVLDIGGDDRGALALGRYVPEIRAEGDYEMLFVINRARPLTRTVADTILVLREIEAACGLPFTAVVNNTNLGQATAAVDVVSMACTPFCPVGQYLGSTAKSRAGRGPLGGGRQQRIARERGDMRAGGRQARPGRRP